MSLSRHFTYNVAGVVLPLFITIFTTPVYLRAIGPERFGVLALLWIVVGYFGLLDLGLSRASANRLAIERDARTATQIFWAALWTSLAIGVAGGVALYAGGLIWQARTSVTAFSHELVQALPALALFIPLATCGGVLTGALESRQRFGTVNGVAIVGSVLFALLPLAVALLFTASLAWLIPAALASRVISCAWLAVAAGRELGLGRPLRPARQHVRELLSFGGWAAVSSFVGTIMNSVDKLAIGAALGAASVAHYVVPYNAISRLQVVPTALLRALFPRMSQADAAAARQMETSALATLAIVMTGLCGALILNLRLLLELWLGAQLAPVSVPVAMILAAGIWCNSLASVPYWSLQARQQPQVPARIHLLQVLPYLVALWAALHGFGLLGAAIAWSGRMLVDALLLARAAKYTGAMLKPVGVGALAIAAALAVALSVPQRLELLGLTLLLTPVFIAWACVASPLLQQKVGALLRRRVA